MNSTLKCDGAALVEADEVGDLAARASGLLVEERLRLIARLVETLPRGDAPDVSLGVSREAVALLLDLGAAGHRSVYGERRGGGPPYVIEGARLRIGNFTVCAQSPGRPATEEETASLAGLPVELHAPSTTIGAAA